MLDKLTIDDFSGYIGTVFRLELEPTNFITLELIEVTSYANRSWHRPDQAREPFSIVFRGPLLPPLPQQMYDLEHNQIGRIEGLFLVPIGEDQQGRYYQAVFS